MTLKECMFIKNSCYIKNQKMTNSKPTGIVVHSTGCNNKTLKRYVQPVQGQSYYDEVIKDIGKNRYNNHWNMSAEEMNRSVCVHAFIGVNDAGKVETYQVLPFDVCCWGVGSGSKGSYNYNPTARIQFEMCEDDLKDQAYFNAVMKEAQEFCAYLCKKFGFGIDKISSHHESYLAGYGGNHGDPENWLKPFGKNMDWFRSEVQKLLDADKKPDPEPKPEPKPATTSFKVGDVVKIASGAVYYDGKKKVPAWVQVKTWIIRQINGDRIVIDKSEDGKNAICSPINVKYLSLAKSAAPAQETFKPYLVKINTSALNIRKGAGTNYAKTGCITDRGVYTIVAESDGQGAAKWGKLKSGAGWISLDYCIKR